MGGLPGGDFIYTLEIIVRTLREVVNRKRLFNTPFISVASAICVCLLYACMLGLHPHSEDHHAHSTRSGKQREIVRYERIFFRSLPQFLGPSDPLKKYRHNLSLFGLLDSKMVR